MDVNDVPQDNSSTYSQNKKAIYATDAQGRVSIVGSSGWDAEETVTKQALDDLQNLAKDAYFAVKNEEKSPLSHVRAKNGCSGALRSNRLFQVDHPKRLYPADF